MKGARNAKLFTLSSALFLFLIFLSSCEEIGPNIDLGGPGREAGLIDTTYVLTTVEAPQTKKVLLEDFTGVRCKNCPLGAAQAASILNTYPGRIVIVAQHSRFLAEPYPGNPDLRAPESQELETYLAPVLGKPSAAIDRRIFSGETAILQPNINKWANLASQAIAATTPVNLTIQNTWDATNRNLKVTVTLHYTGTETGDNRLSIMILEDNVESHQVQPNDEIDTNYVQRHVMRTMLTNFNGELLTAERAPGRVFIKEYLLENIDASWDADELEVVAIVSRSAGSFEVLQVDKADVR